MRKIRVVLDCNVFLQSLLNPRSVASKCVESVRDRRVNLFISRDTLNEFRDVIFRPNIFSKLPDMTASQIELFIDEIVNISALVKSVPTKFRFERDPKDEIFINLAIAAGADFIVSRDNDLLDLMTTHTDEAKEFRQRFRRLKVVSPPEFLSIVKEMGLALSP